MNEIELESNLSVELLNPSLNGIDIESYLSIEWLNPSLNGIDVKILFVGLMVESTCEWN